jgi:hypothetical protein
MKHTDVVGVVAPKLKHINAVLAAAIKTHIRKRKFKITY